MVAFDRGRVKTRLGEGCAELFSQLPSSERSCQYNRLPCRRNRDGSSTRKLDIGVFTQPGPQADSPRVTQGTGAGVGRGVRGELAVELGEQRHAAREAKLTAGRRERGVLRRRGTVDDEARARKLLEQRGEGRVPHPV